MVDAKRVWVIIGIAALLFMIPAGAAAREADTALSPIAGIPAQNSPADAKAPAKDLEASTLRVEDSIVKIFATLRQPDFTQPWTKQSAMEVSGTGFVIEGRRIMTNAHVVLYANQVQVQGNESSDKISASVEFIAPGMDLAVLKLQDESFFESHLPLPRTPALPTVRDSVLVYGYPFGGDNISITKGIVSRIDFASYNYGVAGLRVQIDAALNPGNSGGPALVGDRVAGIAFSMLANSQSIGYIIPCEEIDLFLKDISDGKYDGKYAILDEMQTLENPALRDFLKLDVSSQGLVVNTPFSSDPSYPLKQWDLISKVEGTPVDDQGNILLDDNMKINFAYLVQKLARNGTIGLTIVRGGKESAIQLPVVHRRSRLIPYLRGSYPSYFILGPMVFSVASEDLVEAIMTGRSMMGNALAMTGSPLVTRRNDKPAFEGEELVIVPCPLFADPLSVGYSHPTMSVVKAVNGIRVKNLHHLVEIVRDSTDEYLTFEFSGEMTETLVFHRKEMIQATEAILDENGIRRPASPDLLDIWQQKKDAAE
jgi:S1-C subfamily serine protease